MAEPYEGTCQTCAFVVAHELQGTPTGYGHCTNHVAYQLKKQDDLQKERRLIAKIYNEKLEVPCMPYREDSSYHLFWILVENRDQFRKNMQAEGIETGTHYTPIHYFDLYKKHFKNLPVTEKIMQYIVTIPMHNKLSLDDVDKIITAVNSL